MDLLIQAPQFVWEAAANFVAVLAAGLIIAFATSYIFRKKDERTRVAGVILEKRIDAQHEILQFVEAHTQKFEVRHPYSASLRELMLAHGFQLPYNPHIQCADIFSSVENYRAFHFELEKIIEKNKLWLDVKVRQHLQCMGAYFATINAVLVGFNRIPLPTGVQLSESDLNKLGSTVLLIVGSAIDDEFNRMVLELEVLMVRSIYKLDLKRPKRSYLS